MNDFRDLKAIAEVCQQHQPLRFMRGHGALYIRNDNGIVFDVHQDRAFPEFMAQNKDYADLVLAANPATVSALIAENERLSELSEHLVQLRETHGFDSWAAVLVAVDRLKAENGRLKAGVDSDLAEIDRIQCEYDKQFRKARALRIARDQLKAENEELRDELDQAKYDANAWRNQDESLHVEVYYGAGDDPFISAVQGAICIEELTKIQGVFLQYPDDYFEHGSGLYVFRCGHHEAHYDNVGITEPAHWEIEFESHSRFPWADEQPSTCGSEQGRIPTETPISEGSACGSKNP